MKLYTANDDQKLIVMIKRQFFLYICFDYVTQKK